VVLQYGLVTEICADDDDDVPYKSTFTLLYFKQQHPRTSAEQICEPVADKKQRATNW